MTKKQRKIDFDVQRKALVKIINDNTEISEQILEQLRDNDFSLLEEHTEITKLIINAVKELTEVYKNVELEQESKLDIDKLID